MLKPNIRNTSGDENKKGTIRLRLSSRKRALCGNILQNNNTATLFRLR